MFSSNIVVLSYVIEFAVDWNDFKLSRIQWEGYRFKTILQYHNVWVKYYADYLTLFGWADSNFRR